MTGARQLRLPDDAQLGSIAAWSVLCPGQIYRINLGANEDAVIRFTGSQPLRFPLHITGGRNVRLVGLEMDMTVQPGCAAGQLKNEPVNGVLFPSIHPRLPGGMAMRLEQSGTTYIEGARIDMRGHEADCFVVRNYQLTPAVAREQRHVVLQNTACIGQEGLGASPIGDGVHGDLIQNQGTDVMSTMTLENVTHLSSQEGVVLHSWSGLPGAKLFKVRRMDYGPDTRYSNDDAYDFQWGAAIDARADSFSTEDLYLTPYSGQGNAPLVVYNGAYYGPQRYSTVTQNTNMKLGAPPSGSFAPWDRLGRSYVSPHD